MTEPIDYEAHSHYGDGFTSLEAADKVDTSTQIKRVMQMFYYSPTFPLSDFDLLKAARRIGWKDSLSGLGSRRGSLERAGLLEKVDRDGRSPSGNRCSRFKMTEKGLEWYRKNLGEKK